MILPEQYLKLQATTNKVNALFERQRAHSTWLTGIPQIKLTED